MPDTTGYQVTIMLDSLQASAADASGLGLFDSRMGNALDRQSHARRKLSALTADRSTTLGDQVGATRAALSLAPLRRGSDRHGMDDTTTFLSGGRLRCPEHGITSYRALDSDDPRARRAIKLESTGSYERTAEGNAVRAAVEMSGTGTPTAVHYLSQEGTLISARGSDAGDMTISVPAVGQTVR